MEGWSTFQIIAGALTVIAALNVVLSKNPVVSAMSLMATLFLTGAHYVDLGFPFIGAIQILVYAGAISVLFVFIVMLLDLHPTKAKIPGRAGSIALKTGVGVLLGAALLCAAWKTLPGANGVLAEGVSDPSTAQSIASRFLSKYMVPFQATGLLIFAAIIGVTFVGRALRNHRPGGVQR